MKPWQIVLLVISSILAIISAANVISSRPDFHYVVYLSSYGIIMLSVFYNKIFPSKEKVMSKRREENRKRQENQ